MKSSWRLLGVGWAAEGRVWGRGGRGDAAPGLSGRVGLVDLRGARAVAARARRETNGRLTDGDFLAFTSGEGGKEVVCVAFGNLKRGAPCVSVGFLLRESCGFGFVFSLPNTVLRFEADWSSVGGV